MTQSRGLQCLALSLVLSAIFTYALLYTTYSLPLVADRLLQRVFPDYPFEEWPEAVESLVPYGYLALAVVVALIVLGLVSRATYLGWLGALGLYLPVFGYFAMAMFLLAGIGFLRILWLPIIKLAPEALKLGGVVLLPVKALAAIIAGAINWGDYGVALVISKVISATGGLILFAGVATWLYGRFSGVELVDFWAYRYSRHPQYLGFIVWSYGVLAYIAFKPYIKGAFTVSPALMWLSVVAVLSLLAVKEERDMIKRLGDKYLSYTRRTPFLVPLPGPIGRALTIPHRLLGWTPGDLRKATIIAAIYLVPLILIP